MENRLTREEMDRECAEILGPDGIPPLDYPNNSRQAAQQSGEVFEYENEHPWAAATTHHPDRLQGSGSVQQGGPPPADRTKTPDIEPLARAVVSGSSNVASTPVTPSDGSQSIHHNLRGSGSAQ
ncbi:Uu.00g089840.m01.CDS01 [Anthostomella pinea]|uniref:Uu.00g089840.m01.CDS01 n=1 Tax=Anthostomella pinea TaxID=933095 RepID=A0AAI8VMV8_9PEZI|nr:Uu.00g089840.m01.CDS01 [Anthostomella pinea]